MVAAVESLPAAAVSIAHRAAQAALVQQRAAMNEAFGDYRQPPLDATVRPLNDAAVAHACALAQRGPPAQAAAVRVRNMLQMRVDRERRYPPELQREKGGHLLQERAAEQIGIARTVPPARRYAIGSAKNWRRAVRRR